MSLNIEVDHVTGVLLASGWHHVGKGTFELDTYEFQLEGTPVHSGGEGGICSRGFSFVAEDGSSVAGPLSAILAVRHSPS
jgi:hypothetical protein